MEGVACVSCGESVEGTISRGKFVAWEGGGLNSIPPKPTWPTPHPRRRNRTAPNMDKAQGANTPLNVREAGCSAGPMEWVWPIGDRCLGVAPSSEEMRGVLSVETGPLSSS